VSPYRSVEMRTALHDEGGLAASGWILVTWQTAMAWRETGTCSWSLAV